uniref:Triacylglycerol lipase n=1 Tax=Serinus canaria TaxID=9135 RepID=A0A8C9NKI1_SERCA
MLGIWILGLFLLSAAEGKEVCYDRLGCFSDDAPWSGTVERPIYKLPWKPESIGTQFLLYTRQNENYAQVRTVSAVDKSTITASNFNTNRKTRFIVHGFIDHGEENWLSDMCKVGTTGTTLVCIYKHIHINCLFSLFLTNFSHGICSDKKAKISSHFHIVTKLTM